METFTNEIDHLQKNLKKGKLEPPKDILGAASYALGMLNTITTIDSKKDPADNQSASMERVTTYIFQLINEIKDNHAALDALAGALTALTCERTIKVASNQKKLEKMLLGISNINQYKARAIERAREIATDLWQADTTHEFRLLDMAEHIEDILRREGIEKLPTMARIKEWIKPVAPDYARKGGRRRKTS
ncbi:hypothetical protein [Azotobacter beijerinckii]|uniref:hypothetical protein n=1 Tax=Azotobacter beijerinckii TaxID=170623 RepID=UPI00111467E1|nr:hypothetical protein [Azotobacter beijerinckii]